MKKSLKLFFLFLSFFLLVFALFVQNHFYHNKLEENMKEYKTLQTKYKTLEKDYSKLLNDSNQKEKNLQEELDKTKQEKNALISKYVKTVYLTFDDGPSENTIKILDILKEKNVKATFFPIGNNSDFAKSVYKRIIDEGHTIGNHTFSHNYATIYSSVHAYKTDFYKLQNLIKETTGVTPTIYRFPGGSNNTVHRNYGPKNLIPSIIQELNKEGFIHVDWNVDSLDASKVKQNKQVIINSVLNNSKNKKHSIILFHDSQAKTTTAEALPYIIDELKKRDVVFDVLSKDSFNYQFIK